MILLDLEQGSGDWHAWRADGLGASDAPAIMGESPYATRDQLLREKLGLARREASYATRRGNRLEPVALELYRRELSEACTVPLTVTPCCVTHDDLDWLRASLDGLVRNAAGEPLWVLEIKCWAWHKHDLVLNGVLPKEVRGQIQHQLLVTGRPHATLASYTEHSKFRDEDRLAILQVDADAEYQATLLDALEAFWAEWQARKAELAGRAVCA